MSKIQFEAASWMLNQDGAYLMLKVSREDAIKICQEVSTDKPYEADIKQIKRKRSLDANAYFWVLCGKLAAKVGLAKGDVYRSLIKDVGDNYEVLPIRDDAVDRWIAAWESKGVGWVCEVLGQSKLPGYTNVITYYGSSVYDTAQMSRLISLCVEECKLQGIETMTPQELSLLMEGWDG